jgi:hypothetical protein
LELILRLLEESFCGRKIGLFVLLLRCFEKALSNMQMIQGRLLHSKAFRLLNPVPELLEAPFEAPDLAGIQLKAEQQEQEEEKKGTFCTRRGMRSMGLLATQGLFLPLSWIP